MGQDNKWQLIVARNGARNHPSALQMADVISHP